MTSQEMPSQEMPSQDSAATDLEFVISIIAEAIRALSQLDAEAIEGLAEHLERLPVQLALPRSLQGWARLRSRQWILGHLLAGTGQRLEMLRQLSLPPERLGSYGGRLPRAGALRLAPRFALAEPRSRSGGLASQTAAGGAAE
jgi:hypothetical protein